MRKDSLRGEKMNNLYVCFTPYHLLVSIVNSLSNKETNSTILMVNHYEGSFEFYTRAKKEFENINFHNEDEKIFKKIYDGLSNKPIKKILTYFNGGMKNIFSEIKYEKIDKLLDFNENIFSFNDNTLTTQYILSKNKEISLIEDGYSNYEALMKKTNLFKILFYKILKIPLPMGRNKQIKKIYVENPNNLPRDIRNKGKIFNLKEAYMCLSTEEKESILRVFASEIDLEGYIDNTKDNCLIITQPLSEDEIILEDQKIAIYESIIKKYNEKYNVVIKPHPREKTDYSTLCKTYNLQVLNKNFPLEILNLVDQNLFQIGITLYSSALKNIDLKEKIYLGRDYIRKF